MPKSRKTSTNTRKIGITATSGKSESSKTKVSPTSVTVIKSTSKRYSTALKNLAKR